MVTTRALMRDTYMAVPTLTLREIYSSREGKFLLTFTGIARQSQNNLFAEKGTLKEGQC